MSKQDETSTVPVLSCTDYETIDFGAGACDHARFLTNEVHTMQDVVYFLGVLDTVFW